MSQQFAKIEMRRRLTLIGAMMIHMGDADGMLCGTFGTHDSHRHYVDQVIGLRPGVKTWAAMNAVMLPDRTVFIADTYVNRDPSAEQIAEIALLAADEVRRFGIVPKVALVSHSSFGTSRDPQARKMQHALALINALEPELEVEGEMQGDAALSDEVRRVMFPNSRLKGDANLLIMPTLDAANISFNLLKVAAGSGLTLGPMLLGVAKPVHILTPSATVRRIVNMTALAVVDAGRRPTKAAALASGFRRQAFAADKRSREAGASGSGNASDCGVADGSVASGQGAMSMAGDDHQPTPAVSCASINARCPVLGAGVSRAVSLSMIERLFVEVAGKATAIINIASSHTCRRLLLVGFIPGSIDSPNFYGVTRCATCLSRSTERTKAKSGFRLARRWPRFRRIGLLDRYGVCGLRVGILDGLLWLVGRYAQARYLIFEARRRLAALARPPMVSAGELHRDRTC